MVLVEKNGTLIGVMGKDGGWKLREDAVFFFCWHLAPGTWHHLQTGRRHHHHHPLCVSRALQAINAHHGHIWHDACLAACIRHERRSFTGRRSARRYRDCRAETPGVHDSNTEQHFLRHRNTLDVQLAPPMIQHFLPNRLFSNQVPIATNNVMGRRTAWSGDNASCSTTQPLSTSLITSKRILNEAKLGKFSTSLNGIRPRQRRAYLDIPTGLEAPGLLKAAFSDM